jgi:hypothetical protein
LALWTAGYRGACPDAGMASTSSLYDSDFHEWATRSAEMLRAGTVEEAELGHIAEEIESMGIGQRRERLSRVRVLLIHLLKWRLQPGLRSASWRATINARRREGADLLDQMPSLRPVLLAGFEKTYARAVADAADETGLPKEEFPSACPFTLEPVLNLEFPPEPERN